MAPGVSPPQSLILLSFLTISGGRDGRFLDIVVVCYDVLRSNGRSLYTAFVSDDFRRRSKGQIPPYRFRFQRFPEEVETADSFIPLSFLTISGSGRRPILLYCCRFRQYLAVEQPIPLYCCRFLFLFQEVETIDSLILVLFPTISGTPIVKLSS